MKKFIAGFVLFITILFINTPEAFAYENITVVIDAGHGGSDLSQEAQTGAVYEDGLIEKDVDLITARAMYDELSQYPNLTVYMTRNEDTALSLEERIDYAASVGADLVVSVHYNASSDHLFYGSEIFTSAFGSCYTTGFGVASCIMNRFKEYGLCDKGIRTRLNSENLDYYGVIRHGKDLNVPVIIVEHGYLDNPLDFERIGSEEEWRRLGRIDAEGVADYFGVAKNIMSGSVTPSVSVKLPEDIVYPDVTAPENVRVEIGEGKTDPSDEKKMIYEYSLSCDENESRPMYYNVSMGSLDTVRPGDFAELKLWGNRDVVKDTLTVPVGFSGNLVFRVYNIFELYSDCEKHLKAVSEKEPSEKEGNEEMEKEEGEDISQVSGNSVSGAELKKEKDGKLSEKEDTSSGIIVEKEKDGDAELSEKVSSISEGTDRDDKVIYSLILILATIVFVLLIIIIALIRQGVKGERDDEWL